MPKMPKPTVIHTSGKTKQMDYKQAEAKVQMIDRKPKNAQVVTFSEMDTYRQCPLKHKWSYLDGWRSEAKVGGPLSRGSLWHDVMESHYTLIREGAKGSLDDYRQFMLQHFLTDEAGKQNVDQELVEWMYDGHLEHWGLDDHWEPILIEQAGEVRLRNEQGRATRFFLRFKIDLVVRDKATGLLWLVDHKSAATLSREVEIDLAEQFRLYAWALRQLGIPIHGMIRSDARTKRNKGPMKLEDRYRRVTTFMSEEEGDRIAQDFLRAAQSAYSKQIPVYASPDPSTCSWKCDFLGVHLAARRGLAEPETLMKDFGKFKTEVKHREYEDGPVAVQIRQGRLGL